MNRKFKLYFIAIALALSNIFFVSSASAQICLLNSGAASVTLGTNQSLSRGQSLSSGNVLLAHQTDGNVVVYVNGRAIWATNTGGRATSTFVMQGDGNVVLYGPSGALWASGTFGSNFQAFRVDSYCLNQDTNRLTGIVGIGRVFDATRFVMYRMLRFF
jgi:hypothetical protein